MSPLCYTEVSLCIYTHTHIVDTIQTTKCLVYMYNCVFWADRLYYYEIKLETWDIACYLPCLFVHIFGRSSVLNVTYEDLGWIIIRCSVKRFIIYCTGVWYQTLLENILYLILYSNNGWRCWYLVYHSTYFTAVSLLVESMRVFCEQFCSRRFDCWLCKRNVWGAKNNEGDRLASWSLSWKSKNESVSYFIVTVFMNISIVFLTSQ